MTDTPDLLQLDHAQRLLIDVIAQDCATNGSTSLGGAQGPHHPRPQH
jgi:hypothetical protein